MHRLHSSPPSPPYSGVQAYSVKARTKADVHEQLAFALTAVENGYTSTKRQRAFFGIQETLQDAGLA